MSWRRPRAPFELLVREALRPGFAFFDVVSYEVATRMTTTDDTQTTATIMLKIQDAADSATATGHGPMNALVCAAAVPVRRCNPSSPGFGSPIIKVRVLARKRARPPRSACWWSGATHRKSWATVGVSTTSSKRQAGAHLAGHAILRRGELMAAHSEGARPWKTIGVVTPGFLSRRGPPFTRAVLWWESGSRAIAEKVLALFYERHSRKPSIC